MPAVRLAGRNLNESAKSETLDLSSGLAVLAGARREEAIALYSGGQRGGQAIGIGAAVANSRDVEAAEEEIGQ